MSVLAETSTPVIPAGTWSIDPVWSALEFEVKKLGLVTVKGRVPGFSGTIEGGEAPSMPEPPMFPRSRRSTKRGTDTCSRQNSSTHRGIRHFVSSQPRSTYEADDLVVDGELTIKERHQADHAVGQLHRLGRRSVRERPDRRRARWHRRPLRIRARLERSTSGRRLSVAERGDSQGDTRGSQDRLT